MPTAYRVDIQQGLAALDPATRELLEARMAGASTQGLATRYDCSQTTIYRRLDAAIGELTNATNTGGAGVATKVSVNGTQQTEELERLQQAIARKLAHLPPGWDQVLIKREARTPGEFVVRVQY